MENLNLITYSIYLAICIVITVFVGKHLHKNGYYLILNLFDNELFTKTINNILLIAYYLVNIGYIAITIVTFGEITDYPAMLEVLAGKVGLILLSLGILHINNIITLNILSRRKHKIIEIFNN